MRTLNEGKVVGDGGEGSSENAERILTDEALQSGDIQLCMHSSKIDDDSYGDRCSADSR